MANTIKVIDLLNKLANGEEAPKKVLILDDVYYFLKDDEGNVIYSQSKEPRNWEAYIDRKLNIARCLNVDVIILDDETEIIEEQQDIDIQEIEELPKILFLGTGKNDLTKVLNDIIDNQNQQLQAVKQLDNKIKDKE